jgi:dual specificity phosphatase 12
MDEVVPGLFIGPRESAELPNLQSAGISGVVSIGCSDPRTEDPLLESREKLQYLCFPHILDTPEAIILHIFTRTTDFITAQHQQGRAVLVHCIYGQSRSATVIVAFLLSTGRSLAEALTLLKLKHDHICINPGFLAQVSKLPNLIYFNCEYTTT